MSIISNLTICLKFKSSLIPPVVFSITENCYCSGSACWMLLSCIMTEMLIWRDIQHLEFSIFFDTFYYHFNNIRLSAAIDWKKNTKIPWENTCHSYVPNLAKLKGITTYNAICEVTDRKLYNKLEKQAHLAKTNETRV